MTRTAWTVTVVIVAAALAASVVGVVAIAGGSDDNVALYGTQVTTEGQTQPQDQGDQSQGQVPGGSMGQSGQSGALGQGTMGGSASADDSDWETLYGLPWLAAGLLIGLGATLFAWRPWKQQPVAAVAAAGTGDLGRDNTGGTHAAETATQEVTTEQAADTEATAATMSVDETAEAVTETTPKPADSAKTGPEA